MPTIENALALALEIHRGQTDRAGKPYILHPLHVMMHVQGDDAQMVAILHDVIEDSKLTCADLRERGYPEHIVAAVDALSRREGEAYTDYVERAAQNPLARQVKLADLEHNMDVRRLSSIGPKEAERLERYRRAWERLTT